MSAPIARVRAAFRDRVGRDPDGVWAAPGRVNLMGEHTDYNEGFVLPAAIDRECLVAAAVRADGRWSCASLQEGDPVEVDPEQVRPGRVSGWSAYVLGVWWALAARGDDLPGFDLVVDSRVPAGAGLSSSAALESAAALAAVELAGVDADRTALALAGRRAENDIVGAPVGVMDQVAALHGRADHAVLLDCRSLDVELVPLRLAPADLTLVVLDTRVRHAHADGGYGARRRECEEAARLLGVRALRDATEEQVDDAAELLGDVRLRRARHVATEDARVQQAAALLRAGRAAADLGPVFAASHASMRDDFEISSPELDTAVDAALTAGAVAARMTGGGFGGSAVAVVPLDRVDAVGAAVTAAFADRGFPRPPDWFAVRPADGARRLA